MKRIYLDHAATSPVHPKSAEKLVEVLTTVYGNPSSIHGAGREARKLLDDSREVLADSIGADVNDIILTSGGTESDNLAIFGTAYGRKNDGKHIITSEIEHHAVLNSCLKLEKEGFEVTYLPVDLNGRVSLNDVKAALRPDTILVTIMYGNNEIGTVQPIREIGELLADHPATFHTDAVQAYGIVPLDVKTLNVDLLSVSSHKLNGPKGIGFLYQKPKTNLYTQLIGGEQERKRRAGTENVPAAAAFAEAVTIAQTSMEEKQKQHEAFRDIFIRVLDESGIEYHQNGGVKPYLPHILNISFKGTDVESFLVNLDLEGISASSGSACTAGSIDPSHVLIAMYGKNAPELRDSIRFSFGYGLTEEDVQHAAETTVKIVRRLVK